MRLAKHDGAFTEILVQRDKDPPFVMGEYQDVLITRITRPVSGPEHIMSCVSQLLLRSTPDKISSSNRMSHHAQASTARPGGEAAERYEGRCRHAPPWR